MLAVKVGICSCRRGDASIINGLELTPLSRFAFVLPVYYLLSQFFRLSYFDSQCVLNQIDTLAHWSNTFNRRSHDHKITSH